MKFALVIATIVLSIGQMEASPQRRGFGGNSNTEKLPMKILEENENYKVIRIPASKWVCVEKESDTKNDPMINWREKYASGLQAMMDKSAEKLGKGMFMKLFQYIVGVNKQQAEIKMTSPVIRNIQPLEGTMMKHSMCFWTGNPWINQDLPEPMDGSDVFFMKMPQKEMYVRSMGGYVISSKEWKDHANELKESLKDKTDVDMSHYYTVGYDAPFVPEDQRRNEVWMEKITKKASEPEMVKEEATETTSDDKLESIPFKTLERNAMYELREYEAQTYICTSMTDVDPTQDPMNGWEEKYDNDPYKAMSSRKWKEQPSSKMFMKLFKYILGVNSDSVVIEMTKPVPVAHMPKSETNEDMDMCFWLGTEWQTKTPPSPTMPGLEVKKLATMQVYVHRMGGFMLSYDDYHKPYSTLKKTLQSDGKSFDEKKWMHVSYNSPFTPKNRRNEVWIPKV